MYRGNNMKNKLIIWPIVVGVIVGIIYWFATMGRATIMGISILQLFGTGAFLGALFLMLSLPTDPLKISLFLTLGAEIAIIAKISYDILLNISSHDLLGIDIIFSAVVISISAFAGAYLGKIIKNLSVRFSNHNNK